MSSAVNVAPPEQRQDSVSWPLIAWFGALLIAAYYPVLSALVNQWSTDDDMGHGFFVPAIAAYIAWQKKDSVAGLKPKQNWWGLVIVLYGAFQLYIGTLGAELFLARTSFVITLIGVVLFLGGTEYLKKFAFPLGLLFLMVPIPAIIYNKITFPLQLLATQAAESALTFMGIPVVREGNVLELASQRLNVIEACSGIRSLLTLTFVSLVYGYFFESRAWVRVVLFISTVPIAIVANASRVTLTGVLTEYAPAYSEGFFHEASGMVIFIVSITIMAGVHQLITRGLAWYGKRKHA
jgi:exosortase